MHNMMIEFGTRLKNTVSTLKLIGEDGVYLHNPELVDRILDFLVRSIIIMSATGLHITNLDMALNRILILRFVRRN